MSSLRLSEAFPPLKWTLHILLYPAVQKRGSKVNGNTLETNNAKFSSISVPKRFTYPCLIQGVVKIRLDGDGTVGVRVGQRLPEEGLPF